MFYDPMIAKVCGHGPDRATATLRLRDALDAFVIRGPGHNIPFLGAVLANPRFVEGRLTTNFIAEEYGERFQGVSLEESRLRELAAVAVAMRAREEARAAQVGGRLPGWVYKPTTEWRVELGGDTLAATLDPAPQVAGGVAGMTVEGHRLDVSLDGGWSPGRRLVRARVDGRPLALQADPIPEGWLLTHGGAELRALVRTRAAAEYAARTPPKAPPDTSRLVRSPMPGLIVSVAVAPGQEVKLGQELCVLEAMKMENVLRAERDGAIAEVNVAPRDTVAADQILLTFA
jgi:propionyl-CoA carboxylase alpha chain